MQDYYRNAVLQLIKSGYDIFLPLQKLIGDELVISDGNLLRRCLIRKVSTTQQGPLIGTTIQQDTMRMITDGLSIDSIIASWPLNSEAWLVPVEAVSGMQSIRLSNRDDWLIVPIKRLDAPTRVDIHPDVAKQIKEQRRTEDDVVVEADRERKYYDDILSNEGDRDVSKNGND